MTNPICEDDEDFDIFNDDRSDGHQYDKKARTLEEVLDELE